MLCYILYIFFVVLYAVTGLSCETLEAPIVTIPDGRIAGTLQRSAQNKTFFAYFQIPYALPPVGPFRFKEPLPTDKWDGILNNTKDTKICYQIGKNDPRENEDCLYLNVYTTLSPEEHNKTLPVLVWIHGGSFVEGSGAMDLYGPQFLIDHGIVLVSINYRLGPLGFLSTGDGVIPGNLGLKDQLLALKWVKHNIKHFGGNPEKVTVMGQSAGASAVGYLMLSKKSEGLFRAAIMHSSTPLTCWSLQKYYKSTAYQLGAILNPNFSSKNSSQDLLKLLMNVSATEIKNNALFMTPTNEKNCYPGFSIPWSPIEEPESDKNAIIKGPSHENIKHGLFNRIPILIGFNSQELLLFDESVFENLAVVFDKNISMIPNNNLNIPLQNRVPAGTKIKHIYTTGNFSSDLAYAINCGSDSLFTTPVARHAFLQSRYSDVYFYQFSYKGKIGQLLVNRTIEGAQGVGHQEELEYIFQDKLNWNETEFSESDLLTRKRVLRLWTEFVRTTNPTPEKLNEQENIIWPKVSQDNFSYLDINITMTIKTNPKKYNEWRKIFSNYTSEPLYTY